MVYVDNGCFRVGANAPAPYLGQQNLWQMCVSPSFTEGDQRKAPEGPGTKQALAEAPAETWGWVERGLEVNDSNEPSGFGLVCFLILLFTTFEGLVRTWNCMELFRIRCDCVTHKSGPPFSCTKLCCFWFGLFLLVFTKFSHPQAHAFRKVRGAIAGRVALEQQNLTCENRKNWFSVCILQKMTQRRLSTIIENLS